MENKSQTIVLSLKYVLLAILTGVLVGIIDTVFGRGLLTISDFRTGHYLYLIPFLPFAGLLITWLYYHFSETSLKGMTLVFETGQKKREDIPLLLIPLVMSGTWITHLFGGSAGREGVAVQIGAALSHALGRRFHLPKDSRVMLITGMAAGFGGLFQTPLTAVFFSMEVIVAGKIQYEALLPALIASYTAAYTSHTLGLEKFYVPFSKLMEKADKEIEAVEAPVEVSDVKCEKCGRMMVIKQGRFGKFLACPGFPECRNTKPILHKIGVKCPECGGEVIERKTKTRRIFYGCANYPECKFTSWDRPTEEKCPKCGKVMLERIEKNGNKKLYCSNETCENGLHIKKGKAGRKSAKSK